MASILAVVLRLVSVRIVGWQNVPVVGKKRLHLDYSKQRIPEGVRDRSPRTKGLA